MARAGVGVDMLETARMERALRRTPSFARRVFTEEERRFCDGCARPAQHYAARIAARGAVRRALGVTAADGVGRGDISVVRGPTGRPEVVLTGGAARKARDGGVRKVELSLSLTHEVAVASAVAVSDAVRPTADEAPDRREELRASFKAARAVIDDLERIERDKGDAPAVAGRSEE